MLEHTFTVAPTDADLPLGELIYRRLSDFSPAACRKMVGRKMVVVDGRWVSADYVPGAGAVVELAVEDSHFMRVLPEPDELEVLYEDAGCLVVNKSAGLVVVPERDQAQSPFLNAIMHHIRVASTVTGPLDFPLPVHRIDRDTSGLVLVARNTGALEALSRQFEERTVRKAYLAVVSGEVHEDSFEIDLSVDSGRGQSVRISRKRGKSSTTIVTVVERFQGFTLVKAVPVTGRRHQIRVHLLAVGHPLAVDPLYGGSKGVMLSRIKRGYRSKTSRPEKPVMSRLTLHAAELAFTSPETGREVELSVDPPEDFQRLLKVFRKYAR